MKFVRDVYLKIFFYFKKWMSDNKVLFIDYIIGMKEYFYMFNFKIDYEGC